jgi:alpha-galactosidase
MGSHVSAVPNHQTNRITSLNTRKVAAMSGTFGYELDLGKLSFEEKEEIKEQIKATIEDAGLNIPLPQRVITVLQQNQ